MDIKKASALYFSPTGGTKKIAERIAERVCESADFLDVTVRAQELDFGPEDFVVIAIPVFGGRVPWPFAERLARVRAQGTPAAIVAVYGNRAFDDALLELRGMAELAALLNQAPGPRIVVLNTIVSAACLANYLRQHGHDVLHLSTALTPTDRDMILEEIDQRLAQKKSDWRRPAV